MTDAELYANILSLPADLKKEVLDLVEFLVSKTKPKLQIRQFGCAKGLIKTNEDFNEPLEDFKEYM